MKFFVGLTLMCLAGQVSSLQSQVSSCSVPTGDWRLETGDSQEASGKGFVIERKVKLILRDTLNKDREIQRQERVSFADGNLKIEDLTFGENLIVRSDKKVVWTVDTFAGTYTEHTFDQVRERQKQVLDEIAECRDRVKGTSQEKELSALLEGYGRFAAEPKVEVTGDSGQAPKTLKMLDRETQFRSVAVNNDIFPITVYVATDLAAANGYLDTLAAMGAFPPAIAAKLKDLGGVPVCGTVRYVLFLDRVMEQVLVTSVKPADVPAAEFELPKDLKKVALKGFDPVEQRKVDKPKDFQPTFKEDEIDRDKKKGGK